MSQFRARLSGSVVQSDLSHIQKIPNELWHDIIELAATVDEVDEFATESNTERTIDYEESILNSRLSPEAEKSARLNRRHLLFVCKAWYPAAIRLLWSNVRLVIEDWYKRYKGTTAYLATRDPWEHVKVLRVSQRHQAYTSELYQQLLDSHVFPRVKKLRILSAPIHLTKGCRLRHPKYVCLKSPTIRWDASDKCNSLSRKDLEEGSQLWQEAETLVFEEGVIPRRRDADRSADESRITLPNLENLVILGLTGYSIILDAIRHWDTPTLHTLQLSGRDMYDWYSVLTWASNMITTLHLDFPVWDELRRKSVTFDQLTTLSCRANGWDRAILAPKLRTLILRGNDLNISDQYEDIAVVISRTIRAYPTCTQLIYLDKGEGLAAQDADYLLMDDIDFSSRWLSKPISGLTQRFRFNPRNPDHRKVVVINGWFEEP